LRLGGAGLPCCPFFPAPSLRSVVSGGMPEFVGGGDDVADSTAIGRSKLHSLYLPRSLNHISIQQRLIFYCLNI
jgi:hypothetical protein